MPTVPVAKAKSRWGALSGLVGLALLSILGAWLRFHDLGSESLWLDEGYTLAMARQSLAENLRESLKDVHSPLYFQIVRAFVHRLGEGEEILRLPSALAGSLLPAAVFLLAGELGMPAAAIPAALVAALSSYQIRYAQEARQYSLLVLLATLGMIAFLRMLREGGGPRESVRSGSAPVRRLSGSLLAYVLLTLLCLAIHHYAIFLLIAQATVVLVAGRRIPARGRARARAAMLLLAPFLAAWAWLSLRQWRGIGGFSSVERASLSAIGKTVKLFLVPDFKESRYESIVLAPLLTLSFLPRAVDWIGARRGTPDEPSRAGISGRGGGGGIDPALLLSAWFLATLVLPVAISWLGFPIFRKRYSIAAGVPLYLGLGWGLSAYRPRARTWALGAVGLLLLGSHLGAVAEGPRKEDWRSAAAFLAEREDQCPRILLDDYDYRFVLGYYLPSVMRQRLNAPGAPEVQIPGAAKDPPASGTPRCLVLGPIHPVWRDDAHDGGTGTRLDGRVAFRGPISVLVP